jgi:excisionase family DNA binding protein
MPLQMHGMNARPLGLSTSQAARELGVSLGTVRRWSDMGYLQSYRTPVGSAASASSTSNSSCALQQNSFAVQQNREDLFLQRATG